MIWKLEFENIDKFLESFEKFEDFFPMTVADYIERDENLYLNDDYIKYILYYEGDDAVALMALKKKDLPLPDSQHISIFEVNSSMKNNGYGTHIMKEATEEGKWTLYADDKNRHFYENCGFKKSDTIENFYQKGF